MDSRNVSMDLEGEINKENIKSSIRKINSKYIIKQVLDFLAQRILLKTIKYNKKIQQELEISLIDYKKFNEIEIEIIPIENKYVKKGSIINFINEEDAKYYHIYYNDNNREIKRENKNIITKNQENKSHYRLSYQFI